MEVEARLDIDARKDERGYALIANFVEGFAVGWKMAVPDAFREALDIKLTPRVLKDKKEMLWTQGRLYNFHEGDIFYDTKAAYENWPESLKDMSLCVQVQLASPSGYVTYEKIEIKDSKLQISRQKGNAKPKEMLVDGLELRKQRLDHGLIKFAVYRPNDAKDTLVECETIECTQDDFVSFLQTGLVRTRENEQIDLFEKIA